MTVRAKFRVNAVTPSENDDGQFIINLQAVYSGSPENELFFHLTPGGTIMLQLVKPETAAKFEVGKEYYVDFTSADENI